MTPIDIQRARITTVILALLLFMFVGVNTARSQDADLWEDDPFSYHSKNKTESFDPDAPEIQEPFFALILQWAADDSLGTWTGAEFLDFAEDLGRPSRFPLEKMITFSRRRPSAEDSAAWPGVEIKAIWEVQLNGPQDPPMPYSIFGYHPGTLRVSDRLQLSEIHLGDRIFRSTDGLSSVTEIQVFRLDQGSVVLDVDGWLDGLMGAKLDDAAVVGFVAAREQGKLISLAVSLGKEGRHIFGEFDLRNDKVLPNGRAIVSALSSACRAILYQGLADPLSQAWGKK